MLRTCGTRVWSAAPKAGRWMVSSNAAANTNTTTVVQRFCHQLPSQSFLSKSMASPIRPRLGYHIQNKTQPFHRGAPRQYVSQTTMAVRAARPRAADTLLFAVKQVSIYGGSLFVVSIGAGWAWAWLSLPVSVQTTHCEAMMMADETAQSSNLARRPSVRMRDRNAKDET